MCHRYNINVSPRKLAEIFDVVRSQFETAIEEDLFPLASGPVVRLDEHGDRELILMEWGFLPSWWKPSAKSKSRKSFQRKCFNARSETAHEKPTFRNAFKHRRCIVPALKFEEKGHYFGNPDAEIMAFAGLWEAWRDDEQSLETYTILTTEPNKAIADVGHHRMPVILPDEAAMKRWLSPDHVEREALASLFEPSNHVFDTGAVST